MSTTSDMAYISQDVDSDAENSDAIEQVCITYIYLYYNRLITSY
jgi:hypothetical protein